MMAEAKHFNKRKLIIGLMAGESPVFQTAEKELQDLFGPVDLESPEFDFTYTDYYSKQMGGVSLRRKFLCFQELIDPERLSGIKITTNHIEKKIRKKFQCPHRVVNIDPGILDSSALIMATVKDFAHRIPLSQGIYGHLELLFGKGKVKTLDWTYPDFKDKTYHPFFLEVRKIYLTQLK